MLLSRCDRVARSNWSHGRRHLCENRALRDCRVASIISRLNNNHILYIDLPRTLHFNDCSTDCDTGIHCMLVAPRLLRSLYNWSTKNPSYTYCRYQLCIFTTYFTFNDCSADCDTGVHCMWLVCPGFCIAFSHMCGTSPNFLHFIL